jgi:hypothetical protein
MIRYTAGGRPNLAGAPVNFQQTVIPTREYKLEARVTQLPLHTHTHKHTHTHRAKQWCVVTHIQDYANSKAIAVERKKQYDDCMKNIFSIRLIATANVQLKSGI